MHTLIKRMQRWLIVAILGSMQEWLVVHTLIKRMPRWLIVAILGSMQEWLVVHIASHRAGVARRAYS